MNGWHTFRIRLHRFGFGKSILRNRQTFTNDIHAKRQRVCEVGEYVMYADMLDINASIFLHEILDFFMHIDTMELCDAEITELHLAADYEHTLWLSHFA